MYSDVITWEEYCDALKLGNEMRGQTEEDHPWFSDVQENAISLIVDYLAQSHLFPRNHDDIDDLKDFFKADVIKGIAIQIQYMYENQVYFDNGNINLSVPVTIGQYTQGNQSEIRKIFLEPCPKSMKIWRKLGWNYQSLTEKLKPCVYYKGEK